MPSTRELRGHIRSIRTTRQITRAMEMVAVSKLRRATAALALSKPYALRLAIALRDTLIGWGSQAAHPLAVERPVQKTLLIVISSDRGLAGAYNATIVKQAIDFIEDEREAGREVACITMGRKAERSLHHLGISIVETYPHSATRPTAHDVLPMVRSIIQRFTNKEFERVMVLSTHLITAFQHQTGIRQLLPLKHDELVLETAGDEHFSTRETQAEQNHSHVFLNEPSSETVLDALIPRYLQAFLYQLLQDSLASEQAARRFAMHNATDNASTLVDHLKLIYNTVRQSSITSELAEITAGTVAES